MMKIVLIGADGQLGSDLAQFLKDEELFPFVYPELDITNVSKTRTQLADLSPDITINTAAYHKVDECEDCPERAFTLNAVAVRDLALTCRELDSVLVHFSTDYVFDGKKGSPYNEEDVPNPLSAYAVSKLAGEYFVRHILERYYLIRTCGLYGEAGCWGKGTNFVDTMVNLGRQGSSIRVVNDQWVTPTSTFELAQRIQVLIQTRQYGLYHLSNEGECTWFEFAGAIFSELDLQVPVEPVDSATYAAKAKRPAYSVLENKRATEVGLSPFSHWKDALTAYLKKKGYLA
jgi:dTDP-4-dehydrorhamnose reductase